MKIEFVAKAAEAAIVAVLVFEDTGPNGAAQAYEQAMGGALGRAMQAGRFKGAKGSTLVFVAPSGVPAAQVIAVGAGKSGEFDDLALEAAAGGAYHAAKMSGSAVLALEAGDLSAAQAARAAFAARLASYRFDKYRTTDKPEKRPSIEAIQIVCADPKAAEAAYAPLAAVGDAVFFSRDLVSEPANVLYPAEFAKRCKDLSKLGLEVEILGEAEMTKLGMHTLLGVGQGSVRDSQLVIMRWNGAADKNAQPIAFVGKGVTFDTGGISIKPAEGMEEMKWDMGGAAAVAGLMHALAGRKAKVNAIGVLGLVENMPDGAAQRPGDIVVSMSGQTVEVINTDAEGRLVLADALWYTQERFKPKFMVDVATLTGAIIISLGFEYAGVFSNNDDLANAIADASKITGENTWRMPLPSQYEKMIESPAADMKNTGGRPAGSITAGLFLQKFVNGLPWAHIDIASTAWKKDSRVPTVPEGAAGFGVRLLDQLAAKYEG